MAESMCFQASKNPLLEKIFSSAADISKDKIRIMEVCGTHTMSIFKNGIASLLPDKVELVSGPGCPVCVTVPEDVQAVIDFCRQKDVCLLTFGDMLKVKGDKGDTIGSSGIRYKIIYDPVGAVEYVRQSPQDRFLLYAIGFETTAAVFAVASLHIIQSGLKNIYIHSALKRIMPALEKLFSDPAVNIDGLILPGHVAVITGWEEFSPVISNFSLPSAVAGFSANAVLKAVDSIIGQIKIKKPLIDNVYPGVVTQTGNVEAKDAINNIFCPADTVLRGFGKIVNGGYILKEEYNNYVPFHPVDHTSDDGCDCGKVLQGLISPEMCPLFSVICTPEDPVGPCMVSSEGTCGVHYRWIKKGH